MSFFLVLIATKLYASVETTRIFLHFLHHVHPIFVCCATRIQYGIDAFGPPYFLQHQCVVG